MPTKVGSEREGLLGPLVDQESLRATSRRRRDPFVYKKISSDEERHHLDQGWVVHKPTRTHTWMKKSKSPDARLEDRIWSLFFQMGYPVLSSEKFRIQYKQSDGTLGSKWVDVFAKDDETAIIVECRARETRGRRSLQKEIEEIEQTQRKVSQAVRSHFGNGYNPKIIWLFATANVIWAEKDVERAEQANLRIITENELQYFEAFVSHIGTAGRYQFLAEFLEGQEIPHLENVRIPAVRGRFGAHTYYSFVISARHLLKIAFVNHQALNHPDGRPAYQRMINKKRITDIGAFIQRGGYFPTNILVNFTETCRFDLLSNKDNADPNIKFGLLYLPSKFKSAWVIDGQHRLYGFSNIPDRFLDTSLFVLAFEKMDTKAEADLFITINHEQRSVPKGLLVTLQADLKLGSGDPKESISALASSLVRIINSDNTSPFFRRFEIPGLLPTETQNLTIAEAVKGLVRSNLFGRVLPKKSKIPGFFAGQTDDETLARARKITNGYFRSLMDANPLRWEKGRAAHVCVNPGIRAHFQLIQEILRSLAELGDFDPSIESPEKVAAALISFIEPIRTFLAAASDKQIEANFARKFGEGGVRDYFYNLCEIVQKKHKDFGGEDFKKYKAHAADARVQQADEDIGDLQGAISKVVIETLKRIHGTHELPSGEKAYWDTGIENVEIKQNAYKKQQQATVAKRAPKEAYLDLIDFEKIIKQPSNWTEFEPIFNVPMAGEKGKKYYLTWLEKLNEIRRVSAHKSPYRQYSEEDLEFVSFIKAQLFDQFTAAGFEV
ncbi:MAG TPA: DGQHR domain-containing protein [Bradyrhizobium sp.]|jgi:DNA sulfur modification protein DndB|uniref:DGQHR domain-containing protein n=1 Tax=Bradyrhizobium sp. TaxID=376 RepID=UPI002BCF5BF6|nr:DGQHR domain-containing protein [Bradyrhizobium sp.]HTB04308.1 DGQHR domain-containing protein [Bradyrhizobium sp.]